MFVRGGGYLHHVRVRRWRREARRPSSRAPRSSGLGGRTCTAWTAGCWPGSSSVTRPSHHLAVISALSLQTGGPAAGWETTTMPRLRSSLRVTTTRPATSPLLTTAPRPSLASSLASSLATPRPSSRVSTTCGRTLSSRSPSPGTRRTAAATVRCFYIYIFFLCYIYFSIHIYHVVISRTHKT